MMTREPLLVRVTHRFAAPAERVYDAFLDPAKVGTFLFATATGQVVRCEVDARVGGRFVVVDRRAGEDVEHVGRYVELERPRRIVFLFSVPTFGAEEDRVTIEIAPLDRGCELTLTHEMDPKHADLTGRVRDGWEKILEVAGELLVDPEPTCGIGLAQHATIPAAFATMCDGLAETLELHRRMLVLDDAASRREDEVYADLATRWREIARLVADAARTMEAQRALPMGPHDESAWGDAHLRAFETFVNGQSRVLALLRIAAARDEKMLAGMKSPK
jgi:uncharacterized protein YndB with AHSA1/START domain